jgi:hypothetical protein
VVDTSILEKSNMGQREYKFSEMAENTKFSLIVLVQAGL